MAQVSMLSDEWLSRYRLLENFNTRMSILKVFLILTSSPTPGLDSGARCHGMKACILSDEWLSRYGLLENFNASLTGMRTRTGTGTWTTGVTAIALCSSCSRANKKKKKYFSKF